VFDDEGQKVASEFLATADEHGFVHMYITADTGDVTSDYHLAFAPNDDLDEGECLLSDHETGEARSVSLWDAFHPKDGGDHCFLMNRSDFDSLIDWMRAGELKPITYQ